MGKMSIMRCARCHKPIDKGSQYCKYCGASFKKLQKKELVCPQCNKAVETFSTYCPHCGFNLHHAQKKHSAATVLKYLASLLVVFLLLVIFFTILYKQEEKKAITENPPEAESSLDIQSLSCAYAKSQFQACGKFAWDGFVDDYVTIVVPGSGESQHFSDRTFDYCTDAGPDEGFRVVRMILYNRNGGLVDEVGRGVECKREVKVVSVQPPSRPPEVPRTVKKHGQFRASQTTTYYRGFGSTALMFDGSVQSCTYDGTFYVDDRPVLRKAGHCHKAAGTFRGRADATTQYVVVDPGLFAWDYRTKTDPEPKAFDGVFFTMNPCDSAYFGEPNNLVRAHVQGFNTNTLKVDWEFKDDVSGRAVEVLFDLACQVK